jgi:phage terminase large subunit-like protein
MNTALTHSGDPDLARHVADAVVRVDSRGTRITKEDWHSRLRIDLDVAAIMGHDVAATLAEQGGPQVWIFDQ